MAHRNRCFTHWKWWFASSQHVYWRVYTTGLYGQPATGMIRHGSFQKLVDGDLNMNSIWRAEIHWKPCANEDHVICHRDDHVSSFDGLVCIRLKGKSAYLCMFHLQIHSIHAFPVDFPQQNACNFKGCLWKFDRAREKSEFTIGQWTWFVIVLGTWTPTKSV